jgi:hypothetical protein
MLCINFVSSLTLVVNGYSEYFQVRACITGLLRIVQIIVGLCSVCQFTN